VAEFDLAAAVQEDAGPDQVGVRRELGGDLILGPLVGYWVHSPVPVAEAMWLAGSSRGSGLATEDEQEG
jgi:hypothetical protein